MAALLNRARMTTATTGTGTVTLGSAVTGYASFAEAGAVNATVYSYCIEDGDDFEIGVGTYTSSGTTFSRDTVTLSKIGGTSGTSKINLSGSAEIFITLRVGDLGTAAAKNTGTSGDAVPLLNVENTWGAAVNIDGGLGTSFRFLASTFSGNIQASGATSVTVNFDPMPADGTSPADFQVFRNTNTTATGSSFSIYQADNTSTRNHRFYAKSGYLCGNPTGGVKGVGTINAQAVYDDNTLLSCYVFDAAIDGAVNLEKWDGKVPNRVIPEAIREVEVDTGEKDALDKPIIRIERQVARAEKIEVRTHEGAKKFYERLGSQYDPLDIDKYTAHWKEKRHLSSMPNEEKFDPEKGMPTGTWIQRLIETVEIQAVHIAALNDRLKVLESPKVLKK